jgi:hypothetical protein
LRFPLFPFLRLCLLRRFIDVDELTKFASPSAKESFGISDITKGQQLGVIGLYNKQSQRLLARFVNVVSSKKTLFGTLSDADTSEFTINLKNNNTVTIVDVEKTTKIDAYSKENGVAHSGFSKIKGNEYAVVTGFSNSKEKNRISAERILILSDLSSSAPQEESQTSPTPSPTPKKKK